MQPKKKKKFVGADFFPVFRFPAVSVGGRGRKLSTEAGSGGDGGTLISRTTSIESRYSTAKLKFNDVSKKH